MRIALAQINVTVGALAPNAEKIARVAREAADAGLLEFAFAGIVYCTRLARLTEIERARGDAPDPVLRLAAAGVVVRDDADR